MIENMSDVGLAQARNVDQKLVKLVTSILQVSEETLCPVWCGLIVINTQERVFSKIHLSERYVEDCIGVIT